MVKIKMQEQSENFNKEIKMIKEHQTEIIELKNTITELNNSIEDFNSRLHQTEKKISELKDRTVKIIQSEEKKKE